MEHVWTISSSMQFSCPVFVLLSSFLFACIKLSDVPETFPGFCYSLLIQYSLHVCEMWNQPVKIVGNGTCSRLVGYLVQVEKVLNLTNFFQTTSLCYRPFLQPTGFLTHISILMVQIILCRGRELALKRV